MQTSDRLNQRLAERGQQTREGNRAVIFGPRLAVHLHPELTLAGEGNPHELDFEVFIARIILDRNSQVRFHKPMVTKGTAKTTVHDIVHALRPNQYC